MREKRKNLKFYTKKQIKEWYSRLPREKRDFITEQIRLKTEKTPLQKILSLCKQIVRHDTSFENKFSETERAKKMADKIQEEYNVLLLLIEQVEAKDISLLKDILAMLDHPWMRVLGDQLKQKNDLENKLSELHRLVSLEKREQDYNLDVLFSSIKIQIGNLEKSFDLWS